MPRTRTWPRRFCGDSLRSSAPAILGALAFMLCLAGLVGSTEPLTDLGRLQLAAAASARSADNPLAIKSIKITASPSDVILRRQITITTNGPVALQRYEFGWAKATDGSIPSTVYRCPASNRICWLSFAYPDPNTEWNLLARAVNSAGIAGPWFVKTVPTPPRPILVVGGDSIQSGHHRDREGAATVCQDESYAMGATIWKRIQAGLPPRWRDPHGYVNVAVSGFGTTQMLGGGLDGCGVNHEAELPLAIRRLQAAADSWNTIVWDGGINDTNWGSVLGNLLGAARNIKTAAQCSSYVSSWNLGSTREQVVGNVRLIAQQLSATDPLAKKFWTGYFNVAGTGTGMLTVPSACRQPFSIAVNAINSAVISASDAYSFQFVDLQSTLGGKDRLLQDVYPSDVVFRNSGWPHPNKAGANAAGRDVIAKL